jgi:hypothetical protein
VKLARPDLFHPRIVLAGCAALPEGDGDDDGLVAALLARGLHARWLSWDDPETLDADLVILRATWDYIDRLDEFLTWTRRVRNLLNAPNVVAWNTDKRYLADLAKAGVSTVPSRFFAPGENVRLPAGEVVVKPAVGAGSVGAQRFTDPDAARAHAAELQADGRTVLVQPYDPRIEDGETALVFAQGLVGTVQFFTGVPAALVAVHVLGAAACTAATAALWASMRERSKPEPVQG